MRLPQRSHITRKRGVYYFRRRLPAPGSGEVAISLCTRNFREAEHLAGHLDVASDELFSEGMYDSAKVMAALKAERARKMGDARRRVLSRTFGVEAGHEHGERRLKAETEVDGLAHSIRIYEDILRTGDLSAPESTIRRAMAEHGLPAAAFAEFGLGWVQAALDGLKQRRHWIEHGLFDFSTPAVPVVPEGLASAQVEPAEALTSPLLSVVVPQFIEHSQSDWRGQTLHQNRATLRMFLEHCGDKPVTSYGKRDVSAFLDVLKALLALYSKAADWRGLSLTGIAEKSKYATVERLSPKTIQRHISTLGGLFGYMKQRDLYEAVNPAYGLKMPKSTKRASAARDLWEGQELTALFRSPVWTGCKSEGRRSTPGALIIRDEKYWLPLLGLYHGNRLEEFAQLALDDIHQEDGFWCLNINDEEDKQVKNDQSIRLMPMHPELVRLGFLGYLEGLRDGGATRAFLNLMPGGPDNKLGFYFTKWWSRYRESVGLYRKGLDYHSFRHGVTTKLFANNVPEAVIDALVGHEGKSTSRKVYLKRLPIAQLHGALCLVQWPEVSLPALPGGFS